MEIKGQKIEPIKFSVDKDISTDELKLILGEENTLEIVQGKKAKETVVSVEDSKVYVNSKSKTFWTVDKIEVKDEEENEVEVKEDDEGFSFIAVTGTTYLITVIHKFRALLLLLLAFLAIALITIPLLFSNKPIEPVQEQTPIGNYEVGGKQEKPVEVKPQEEVPTITFTGYGKYTVSKDSPCIELHNSEVNFVDMVYTISDEATGDVIARTEKVSPGNYVYVNVVDYYKVAGNYNVLIVTSTTDSESGQAMNGMNQRMEVIVE